MKGDLQKNNWKLLNSKIEKDLNFFQVIKEKYVNPRNRKEVVFYHLKLRDWTVVIPVTKNKELVIVKQFRPGAKKYFYEFPGGLIDREESPQQAAKRELLEETGYNTEKLILLNESYPLPAFQTSKCYIFLAENVVKQNNYLKLDEGEDIEIMLLPFQKVKDLFLQNKFDNSIMALAFSLYLLKDINLY